MVEDLLLSLRRSTHPVQRMLLLDVFNRCWVSVFAMFVSCEMRLLCVFADNKCQCNHCDLSICTPCQLRQDIEMCECSDCGDRRCCKAPPSSHLSVGLNAVEEVPNSNVSVSINKRNQENSASMFFFRPFRNRVPGTLCRRADM